MIVGGGRDARCTYEAQGNALLFATGDFSFFLFFKVPDNPALNKRPENEQQKTPKIPVNGIMNSTPPFLAFCIFTSRE